MRLLTIPEVGERLGMDRNAVYRRINAGHLRTVNIGLKGSKMRVREDDLDAYIASRTHTAPSDDATDKTFAAS